MITLRGGSARMPLLVTHGMQCDISFAVALANALPEDQPIHAFRAAGLSGHEPPLKTIEEMAARYLDEAKPVVAGRPFVLVSFCAGVAVGMEMIQQVKKSYGVVAHHFIIDVARTTDTPQFANVAREQIQIAKLRPERSAVHAAEYAAGGETVAAFVTGLVRYTRVNRNRPSHVRSTVLATGETLPSMQDPHTGWKSILPAGSVLAAVCDTRAELLSTGMPKLAARIYASSVLPDTVTNLVEAN